MPWQALCIYMMKRCHSAEARCDAGQDNLPPLIGTSTIKGIFRCWCCNACPTVFFLVYDMLRMKEYTNRRK